MPAAVNVWTDSLHCLVKRLASEIGWQAEKHGRLDAFCMLYA